MRILALIIFFIYGISLIFPNTERFIYNNEIFALLGFATLVYTKFKNSKIEKELYAVYIFVIYGFFELFISIGSIAETQPYLTLRTMCIWYSCFSFFLGSYCIKQFSTKSIVSFRSRAKYISWASLFVTGFRLTPQVLFAAISGERKKYFLIFIFAFCVIKGGATSYTALLAALILYASINFSQIRQFFGKRILLLIVFCFMVSLYFLAPVLANFLAVGYDGVGGDNNITWRLMLWIYLFNEVFLNNPVFGIGFGTPLFNLATAPSFITTDDGSRLTEYTLGTHNSFFFVSLRLGSIGLLLIALIHYGLFSRAIKSLREHRDHLSKGVTLSLILAGILFVNSALFNVVLESPLYASNYWFTLGLMYQFSSRALTASKKAIKNQNSN